MNGNINFMKSIDIFVAVLLVIGGLNWGLIGFFGFDLVAAIFGAGSTLTRIIYAVVGLCALYQIVMWRSIQYRWGCRGFPRTAETLR